MRVAVDGGGFVAAGTAAHTANQVAALHYDSLSVKLDGFGGMAGNDATSTEFARTYDAASSEALDALADLSAAFIGLGRLIHATDANHARAEAAAAGLSVSTYSGRDLHDDDYVRARRTTPPSTLGAQEPGFGEVEAWILDRIEGFVWPGADVSRLRDAGSTWRHAAIGVDDLVDYCERASVELGRQLSPEIPLALDAVDELRSSARELRNEFGELARMCEDYAASVEAAHERTRVLLAEIVQMVVEGMVLSAAVGLITGGTASGAVASATVARVLAQAPRFRAVLMSLDDAASVCASRLTSAREAVVAVRARLEKFVRLDLRNERGAVSLPGRWPGRLSFSSDQLQRKFKHASAFGVTGPYNSANAHRFEKALEEFMESGALHRKGTMRGQEGDVIFHYDEYTRKCIATTTSGEFISGWILSTKQLAGVIQKGHLGGG